MNNRFSRTASALGLMFSLATSALSPAFFPATVFAQEQKQVDQKDKKAKSKKTDKSDKAGQAADVDQQNATLATTASASSSNSSNDPKRPLSVNDDPSMIGKRNINKGLTGWLGGSQAK